MKKNALLIGGGSVAAIIVVAVLLIPDAQPIPSPPIADRDDTPPEMRLGGSPPSVPAAAPSQTLEVAGPALPGVDDWKTESNLVNNMRPEDQPRAYQNFHFHSLAALPDGYEAEGIVLTPRGIELEPHIAESEGRRIGVLVSAPEPFDFPVNAFAPMWLEEIPPGTAIMVEVAVSPDGKAWSEFQYAPIDVDHALDIMEFYPDGSRNPNYGYTPGAIYAFGDLLYTQMRYRVTMISDSDATPSMATFRTYHMDSTMGMGRVARAEELPQPLIFDDMPLDQPSDFEFVYQPGGDSATRAE